MEYEEILLLKQSEKSRIYLVRQKDGEQLFIRKVLRGQHPVYLTLQSCPHPCLPKLYEVSIADGSTTVVEEYIRGRSLSGADLSEKQLVNAVKELCSVLGFLHERGVIHRDIKPSNIMLAEDGHIRLIDFDAARLLKDDLAQDTRRLGTRGYAPPEQYGFSQTDARADIYALGVTLRQLLGEKAQRAPYRRIIRKCTSFHPARRYQSAWQVKRALSIPKYVSLWGAVFLFLLLFAGIWLLRPAPEEEKTSESGGMIVLSAPKDPHWDKETGIAVWGNVPESGVGGEAAYNWQLYKKNTAEAPDPERDKWYMTGSMRGNGVINEKASAYEVNLADTLEENGYYYFAVSAIGDGVNYVDSPYVMSDAFLYTGESAPTLPVPTDLAWQVVEDGLKTRYFATWSNLDAYADRDSFNVYVYDENGAYVMNNIWTKGDILSSGLDGVWIDLESAAQPDSAYRFTVQVCSSRPNEYRSILMPDPVPEESFSPWCFPHEK